MVSVGQKIGKAGEAFLIEKELGSGAMGTVYRVRYEKNKKRYALKIISLGVSGNETAVLRFEREYKILKKLKHPNIVGFFADGRYKGTPFIVMEYVEGESLDHIMARRVRFSWQEVVEMGKQICAALQHAHEKGVIHRDLKPSNLMRLDDGTIKLTDFGIAKGEDFTALTGDNNTVGTAAYMSPEQCRGEKSLTPKSDLYALGVVFFELLTGRKPFTAESPIEMFQKHVGELPPRPSRLTDDVPVWLDTVILSLLEKKPEHRPLNADMVSKALDEVMANVNSGKSAAVDAVQARVGDRRYQTALPDDTDREAARTLRSSLGKKRGRKKGGGRGLVTALQAAGLLVLLVLVGAGMAFALRPPSANSLFKQAQGMMQREESYDAAWARIDNKEGPVQEFLRRYPDDSRAGQVREWADIIHVRDLLRRLEYNAKKPKIVKPYAFKLDPNYEAQAFLAFRFEEFGDLWYSRYHWSTAHLIVGKDPEQGIAAKLAERRYNEWTDKWRPRSDDESERRSYVQNLLKDKIEQAKKSKAAHRIKDADDILTAIVDLYGDKDKTEPNRIEALVKEATDLKKPPADKK
jgi:serine/threonine-protein kinase